MKKTTKGALAASAALVLLLSTAGTPAYWNSTVPVGESAVITAGNLAVTQTGDPVWTIKHVEGAVTTVEDIDDVRIVPGDTLTFSADYEIAAEGDNLVIQASVDGGCDHRRSRGR